MSETISGSYTHGITLSVPTTITSSGSVSATGIATAITSGLSRSVLVNYGHVSNGEVAVYLATGGLVHNEAGATVEGLVGVGMLGLDTVVNAGTISGLALGVSIYDGAIINQTGGLIVNGVNVVTGIVQNAGTITGALGDIVALSSGGTVSNVGVASRLIGGGALGVGITGGLGYVTNQGIIGGISLQSGGSVVNQGYVALGTGLYALGISGGAGSVNNAGTIVSVELQDGGSIVNEATGLISGNYTGINLTAGGEITNFGTVFGTGGVLGKLLPGALGGFGVELTGAGTLDNASLGLIAGTKYGIELTGTGGGDIVINDGTISGKEGLRDQSSMNNTIVENGAIIGSNGTAVVLGSGNDLLILGTAANLGGVVIGGSGKDIVELSSSTFANVGSEFINIDEIINVAATLALVGTSTIAAGEVLTNSHVLTATSLMSHGTIENAGSILGQIWLGGTYADSSSTTPAELVNEAGGIMISSSLAAINGLAGSHPVIVENAGTIINQSSGGYAISFNHSGANELILDPGSEIIGKVDGGSGGGSVLVLASGATAGTISAIGSSFSGFSTISIAAGATWEILQSTLAGLDNSGTLILDPTTVTVTGAMLGTGVTNIEQGSELILDGSAASGATILFTGTDGTLALNESGLFDATISSLGTSDVLDLKDVSYSNAVAVSVTNGNYLEVREGTSYTWLQLDPSQSYQGDYFHIASDGLNGTDVTENAVPCFLAGTNIATPSGEVPVEQLQIGDMICLAGGQTKAVKWVGRRFYSAPLPNNPDVVPVLIKAGALADGKPNKDLYLSPLHAVMVDEFLVPAGALVNGVSVLCCADMQEVSYYHLELESHEAIIANGTGAETFIDYASRRMFDNAEEYYRLYPQGWMEDCVLCAPRLEGGSELERLRRKVALRAGLLLEHARDTIVVGFLEEADRQTISGWAYAPSQPNLPVSLDILNRGALLARTIANVPRPDVKLAGYGNGRCGFSITLPGPLPALMRHEISVRPTGSSLCLAGSPMVIDPGVAHDLLKTGGLQSLIDVAVKTLASPRDVAFLGSSLEAAGRHIQMKAEHPVRKARLAANSGEKPLILILDEFWPTVTRDAGSNAVMSHVQALQQLNYKVAFCATTGAPPDAAAYDGLKRLESIGVECHGFDGINTEQTIRQFGERGVAAIYLHRLTTASAYIVLVKQHAKTAKVIFSVADLHHLRVLRQAEATGRSDLLLKAKSIKDAEFWAMRLADCVITHSRFEVEYLRHEAPQVNAHLVPWAVASNAACQSWQTPAHRLHRRRQPRTQYRCRRASHARHHAAGLAAGCFDQMLYHRRWLDGKRPGDAGRQDYQPWATAASCTIAAFAAFDRGAVAVWRRRQRQGVGEHGRRHSLRDDPCCR